MPTYNPGIPTGTVPLNLDYQNIQNNFTVLNTLYNTDHVPLTNTDVTISGYHQTIHSVPFSTTSSNPPNNQPVVAPTAVTGVGEIFTAIINDGVNTATALYFQTDTGLLTQLTRNFLPVGNTNGYTFLPGGLILQWGSKTVAPGANTVTFATNNIAFPANCWNVIAVPFYTGSGTSSASQAVYIAQDTLSKTKFDYSLVANSSGIKGFFWIAIGN